jgi:hypothetical protein
MNKDMEINDDIFATLNKCGIFFSPQLIFFMKSLGFTSFRAIKKIEVYGVPKYFDTIDEADKVAQFGQFFCKNPAGFILLPGEIATLECAVEVCSKIYI